MRASQSLSDLRSRVSQAVLGVTFKQPSLKVV